jgi:hypothetical protein
VIALRKYHLTDVAGFLCRSPDAELDERIFDIFDVSNHQKITQEELTMMLMNLPDIGFSTAQSIYAPDQFYTNIRDAAIFAIHHINQNNHLERGDQRGASFERRPSLREPRRTVTDMLKESQLLTTSLRLQSGVNTTSAVLRDEKPAAADQRNFNHPQARDLYLQLRQQMVEQSKIFFEQRVTSPSKIGQVPTMSIVEFKEWLARYPFIRSIVRESVMPRVWTLQPDIHAVRPLPVDQSLLSEKTGESTTVDGHSVTPSGLGVSCIAPTATEKQLAKPVSASIMPLDSIVVKEGELLKIGKRTGTMRTRYYVLRDQCLFIYSGKNQKIPQNVVFLRGLFINQVLQDKKSMCHGFCITHEESKLVKVRIYYHKNQEVIEDWVRLLRAESANLSFE